MQKKFVWQNDCLSNENDRLSNLAVCMACIYSFILYNTVLDITQIRTGPQMAI